MKSKDMVRAGWLMDGSSGSIRRDVFLEMENGFVTELGWNGSRGHDPYEDKSHRRVWDLSDCTLIPGLIDCHVHLSMSGTPDRGEREHQLSRTFEEVKPVIEEHLRHHASRGIVAVRDGGDAHGHTLWYKKRWMKEDCVPVRLKSPGKAWRSPGRYGRLIGDPPPEGSSLADCVARYARSADHVKIVNSGLNSLREFGKETLPQFNLDELRMAVRRGEELGRKTMVHANGKGPVSMALKAGCHSIEHGFFMQKDNLERLAEQQVYWVPTLFTMKAYASLLEPGSLESRVAALNLESQLEQVSRARAMGVLLAVGTDSGSLGVHHGTSFVEELKLLQEAGLDLHEILRAATLHGAALLGVEDECGPLRVGSPATFVALLGPPSRLIESLSRPTVVCIRGVDVLRGSMPIPGPRPGPLCSFP